MDINGYKWIISLMDIFWSTYVFQVDLDLVPTSDIHNSNVSKIVHSIFEGGVQLTRSAWRLQGDYWFF